MLFKPEHKEMILNGTKTATRRNWVKPYVIVGHTYPCKLKMLSKDTFARIKVLKVFKQKLKDMTLEDCRKEGYSGMKEFVDIWIKINGIWNYNMEVYVIEFELLNSLGEKE